MKSATTHTLPTSGNRTKSGAERTSAGTTPSADEIATALVNNRHHFQAKLPQSAAPAVVQGTYVVQPRSIVLLALVRLEASDSALRV